VVISVHQRSETDMETRLLEADVGTGLAAELLSRGELVAFPTETVYGLGGDARREEAVRRIYEAKGRPAGNPVIVHVADVAGARACAAVAGVGRAAAWNDAAEELARRFWPGPLTVIVRRGTGISPLVSAGRETVAVRCPSHPGAQMLLKAFGGPIAAPSANRSGFTSPTTAQHVLAELGGRVPLILDGGACAVGVESTVLDLTTPVPRVLRPGAVTVEMLREAIGTVETVTATVREAEAAASPGQYSRHYAPRTAAYWFSRGQAAALTRMAARGRVVLITHDPAVRLESPHEVMLLPAEASAYARALFASLRQADEAGASSILVLLPDTTEGLWAAVVDRLKRAAEPLAM
jgi:L-threonylcarbamoyladenylate synthase